MHVLLIEDDLDLGQAIVTALRRDGMSVLWQRVPAAEGLDRERIDAVLLDLGLPRTDGMDLLRNWRIAGWTVPVMVVSARGTLPERLAGPATCLAGALMAHSCARLARSPSSRPAAARGSARPSPARDAANAPAA